MWRALPGAARDPGRRRGGRRRDGGACGTDFARALIGLRRKAMPKLLYTLIAVPKLKKMLKECHLSAQGSREQLVRRHQEFTHIYNAQCDALNPKSAEEIAKEVENNERLKSQMGSKQKPVIITTKNQTAEEIEELHSMYRKQHSSEFSRLIAQVRGRLETSKRAPIKQEEGKSAEETDSKAPSQIFSVEDMAAATQCQMDPFQPCEILFLDTASEFSSPEVQSSLLQREVSIPIGKMFEDPVKRHPQFIM
ncbi:hypothetical protein cypCar_00028372 [Cyprinus carpio]|nr:hypothetical protein cypCar_00028372 [Cyprinus carpio]